MVMTDEVKRTDIPIHSSVVDNGWTYGLCSLVHKRWWSNGSSAHYTSYMVIALSLAHGISNH
ncbi:hypothetical protein QTP88_011794 [Uroleucon formosanum]